MELIKNFIENKKPIKTITNEIVLELFPMEENPFIDLDKFSCVTLGKINGQRSYKVFRILKCKNQPLVGVHEIEYQDEIIEINSFLNFKKHYLCFEGDISFLRVTYLLYKDHLINLTHIRHRIRLPNYKNRSVNSGVIRYTPPVFRGVFKEVKKEEVLNYISNILITLKNSYFHIEDEKFDEIIQEIPNNFAEKKFIVDVTDLDIDLFS